MFNNSNGAINLNGWQLINSTTSKTLSSFTLPSKSYVIICNSTDSAAFASYGNVIGIPSFVSLTNTTDSLTLLDDKGNIVDIVTYTDQWYKDINKVNGGWTLELINPNYLCGGINNWKASTHASGGTPGKQNTAFDTIPDKQAPTVVSAIFSSPTTVEVRFSENLNEFSLKNGTYTINNGLTITSILPSYPLYDMSLLTLNNAALTTNSYTITISGISDCSGNSMIPANVSIILPDSGSAGDVIINEVLFDPIEDGSDFVEIYNNSSKSIALKDWKLATISKDTISSKKTITSLTLVIPPRGYIVLTKDSLNIKQQYSYHAEGTFIQMPSLPTYSNAEGTVILLNNKDNIVDRFDYTDKMHFALLRSVDGVSLERLDFNRPTNDKTNWHSAAENVGFATPGLKNSQYNETEIKNSNISLSPEIFSPDNDGFNDVISINYKFDAPGYIANVIIYDSRGREIKHLLKNQLLGNEGTFSWDGTTETREQARIGIYLIYAEVFNLNGNVEHFKLPCVVAGKI